MIGLAILTVIRFLLAVITVVSFFWTILGIPVGTILLLIYLLKKNRKKNKTLLRWILVSFSGFPSLVLLFILWALLQLTLAIFGVDTLTPLR